MKKMFTIKHIEIRDGIHFVKSMVYMFENKYKVKKFPCTKVLNNTEYLILDKIERVGS